MILSVLYFRGFNKWFFYEYDLIINMIYWMNFNILEIIKV